MRDRLLRDPDLERDLRLLDLCRTVNFNYLLHYALKMFSHFLPNNTHFQFYRFHDKPTGAAHLKRQHGTLFHPRA